VTRVEVRVDSGPWRQARIDRAQNAEFAWKTWSAEWPDAAAGEHSITSRAVDAQGKVQPAADAPEMVGKRTYWESNAQVTRKIQLA